MNKTAEPLLPLLSIERAASLYRFGRVAFSVDPQENPQDKTPFRDPWVSPAFLSDPEVLKGFPPISIHVGSVEVLLSDSLIFARRVNEAFADVEAFSSPQPLSSPPVPADEREERDSNNNLSTSSSSREERGPQKVSENEEEAPTLPDIEVDGTLNTPISSSSRDRSSPSPTTASSEAAKTAEGLPQALDPAESIEEPRSPAVQAAGRAAETEIEILEGEPPVSPPADFGALTAPELLAFLTAESLPDEETLQGCSSLDPSLPPFFHSLGWMSQTEREILSQEGTVSATQPRGGVPPNATVTIWKDEFHVFPCFGFLEEPSASECTRRIAQWINKQFGETVDEPPFAAATETAAEGGGAAAGTAEEAAATAAVGRKDGDMKENP